MTYTQSQLDEAVRAAVEPCPICKGERRVKVGFTPVDNVRVSIEYDPCPGCTPPPHTYHAKKVAAEIAALRALAGRNG